jgi:hypothetical protein
MDQAITGFEGGIAASFPAFSQVVMRPYYPFEEKDGVFLRYLPDARLAPTARIAAIILPRVVDRPGIAFSRVKPMEALRADGPLSTMGRPDCKDASSLSPRCAGTRTSS